MFALTRLSRLEAALFVSRFLAFARKHQKLPAPEFPRSILQLGWISNNFLNPTPLSNKEALDLFEKVAHHLFQMPGIR